MEQGNVLQIPLSNQQQIASVLAEQSREGQAQAKTGKEQKAAKPKPYRVDAAKYLPMVGKLGDQPREICCYCGSTNVAAGEVWVCHRCEAALSHGILAPKLADHELIDSLKAINDCIKGEDFAKADELYGKIIEKYKEPAFLYRYAMFNYEYSNSEVRAIRYDRPGFMEENSSHRVKSGLLNSKAKELFNKVIWLCGKELEGAGGDAFLVHAMFMSCIKLGNMKAAKLAMERAKAYGNQYLQEYEGMVFYAELGDPRGAAAHADALTGRVGLSANAFYYIAWAAFKLRMTSQARKLAEAIAQFMDNNSVHALLKDAQEA